MSNKQLASFHLHFATSPSSTLQRAAIDGELRDCPIRGLVWRVLLGALVGPPSAWPAQLKAQRREFETLCERHCVDPSAAADAPEADLSLVNPLSVEADSPFRIFFETAGQREQIENDLMRLHPGNAFFARPDVQKPMSKILLLWSSVHSTVGYRQGMHELLAPLLYACCMEAEEAAGADAPTDTNGEDQALLTSLIRVTDVEVATWSAFVRLMSGAREFFEPGLPLTNDEPAIAPSVTPLLKRCATIQGERLSIADPSLHARLLSLQVEPQLYLLRWLRLLFGREFHLEDVSVVWDALFAFDYEERPYEGEDDDSSRAQSPASSLATAGGSNKHLPSTAASCGSPSVADSSEPPPTHLESIPPLSLSLVDDFAVAMLIYVRADLLRCDFTMMMKRLLKYPPVSDVSFMIQRALQLRRSYQMQLERKSPPAGPWLTVAQAAKEDPLRNGTTTDGATTAAIAPVAAALPPTLSSMVEQKGAAATAQPPPAPAPAAPQRARSPPSWPPVAPAPAPLLSPVKEEAGVAHKDISDPTPPQQSLAELDHSNFAAVGSGEAAAAAARRRVELAARLDGALNTLNSGLRGGGDSSSGSSGPGRDVLFGSPSHERMVKALDEMEEVRKALLEEMW